MPPQDKPALADIWQYCNRYANRQVQRSGAYGRKIETLRPLSTAKQQRVRQLLLDLALNNPQVFGADSTDILTRLKNPNIMPVSIVFVLGFSARVPHAIEVTFGNSAERETRISLNELCKKGWLK